MYTVSKGPSTIVAKTRRGFSQNLERLETRRDIARKLSDSDNGEVMNMPKPVFQSNGKKTVHQRIHHDITPQHEEMIRYINETWTQVCCDSEPPSPVEFNDKGKITPTPSMDLYYTDSAPSPVLRDFKPFDLETWWGKRLFQNITNSL